MRKILTSVVFSLVLMVGIAIIFLQKNSEAQTPNFYRVVPFSTSGGMVGFFDQQSGKVYLYDDKLQQCVMISQMTQLGSSMSKIK